MEHWEIHLSLNAFYLNFICCATVCVCVRECACNTFPLILSGVSVLELKPLSPNPLLAVTSIYSFAFVSLYLYLCIFVRIMLLLLLLTFARRSIIIIIKVSPHLLKLLIRGNGSARHLHNASAAARAAPAAFGMWHRDTHTIYLCAYL